MSRSAGRPVWSAALRRTAFAGSVALALAATALPAAAQARDISVGHIDALDVDYVSGALSLDIRDFTSIPVNDDLDPADAVLHALPGSQTTVPGDPTYSFLGSPGSPVWILPQTQNTSLLWPGWDTFDVPAAGLTGDVQVELQSVSGPGSFALWTTVGGNPPVVRFNSADGLPDSFNIPRGVHAHGNWGFTAAGTYKLTFQATATIGGVVKQSAPQTYTFVVGS